MIYDVIVIALAALFVIIGTARGAARTVLSLLFSFLSYSAALMLGEYLAGALYQSVIKGSIIESVSSSVTQYAGSTVSSAVDALPSLIRSLFSLSGESLDAAVSAGVDNLADAAATTVESALEPIITSWLSFIFIMVIFFIISFLLRHFAMRPAVKLIENMPVVRKLNRFLGGVFGLLEAVVVICILAFFLKILVPYLSGENFLLSESTIYNSVIFYHFYNGNIFTALSGVFSGLFQ